MPRYKPVNPKVSLLSSWDFSQHKKIHVAEIDMTIEADMDFLSPHQLDFYALRLVRNGSGTIFIDHVPYEIENNWVTLATPHQISWIKIPPGDSISYCVIAFTQSFVDLLGLADDVEAGLTGLASHINLALDKEDQIVVNKYFDLLHEEFVQQTDESDHILAGLLKALLLHLMRKARHDMPYDKRQQRYHNIYRQFLGTLAENYKSMHYVADYVDALFINEKQLNRACKSVAGKTASQIIHEHLNFEAKRLLFYSTNTVKEIAFHLGFKDPAHFVKQFKKLNSITPGDFRGNL